MGPYGTKSPTKVPPDVHWTFRKAMVCSVMHITWKRRVIGRDELPYDFCAYVENITIARIFRNRDSDNLSVWSVKMQIGNAATDSCLTMREAIDWVEHRFAHFLTTEAGKRDPQEWPHDILKQSDPAAYHLMLDLLGNGRLPRIAPKK
ncbi:hypothetical protein SAMN04515648_0090 [Phyllobacterium sp. CL33Tsu]|nr:hypothetical protein SAMN04515648_0090 [Phyllobacterium sp. CL33Tsu]